ncbi:MAG: DUF3857 domain-containing transglutaminase family protein [Chitinophagaceae bacterium]|nr:DUF3857 domain-containing transglutaminase family protein [Chitinophagaceae bacterium]
MKLKYTGLLFFLLFSFTAEAQVYAVSAIPDSLKENAIAVKRIETISVQVKSLKKVIVKHKYAITILKKAGDEYAEYSNSYSSLNKLNSIDGTLYDETGKKIRSVKKKDIEDVSVSDGSSLALDSRTKSHHFHHSQYPYTVEYEDEEEIEHTFLMPSWHPVDDEDIAVQQSSFYVEAPLDFELRYRQINWLQNPIINSTGSKTYLWELKNFKALQYEPFRPPLSLLLPAVYIGATKFTVNDYSGDMSTWGELGKFISSLNKNRDALPEDIKNQVRQIANSETDIKRKVEKLYEFMQQNTRYVSVQLGIGSWQPFDAQYVAKNKYGDCKALSNYMVALLKEAGIKANYVLITAGKGKQGLYEPFPAAYFNHAIVCVPIANDSIWLECTSQHTAAGYMGSFTGDRKALLIEEDKGYVVNTPVYTADMNKQIRTASVYIDETGNAKAEVITKYVGEKQEFYHDIMYQTTTEEKEKFLNQAFKLPTYKVTKFNYKETKGRLPSMEENLSIHAPNLAVVSGKRLFITPNLFNKYNLKLSTDSTRKNDIVFITAHTEIDTLNISIPIGYIPEAVPKNMNIIKPYASYSVNYIINGTSIQFIRKEIRRKITLPPSQYDDVVDFFNTISKADNSRIVFVKKEG